MSPEGVALARDYERRRTLFPGWRQLLVRRLAPRAGDTVLDVGAGPGLNLPALRAAVGPRGSILAIEPHPELIAVAATRVSLAGWDNVELLRADPGSVRLSVRADAALFAEVPEILGSPPAVANILGQLRTGARIAAGGWNRPTQTWLWPLRMMVTALQGPDPSLGGPGLGGPGVGGRAWRLLAAHLDQLAGHLDPLQVSLLGFGTGYLAHTHITHITHITHTPITHARAADTSRSGSVPALPAAIPEAITRGPRVVPTAAESRDTSPQPTPGPASGPTPDRTRAPVVGTARQRFLRQVRPTIDPLTTGCVGLPVEHARGLLRRAWWDAFGVRLPDPVLTDCARALSTGDAWTDTLWHNGWADHR